MANQIVKKTLTEELAIIFDSRMKEIIAALPANCGLTPPRIMQFALQASKSDQLRECTSMSIFEAALECATLGLVVGGPLAQGYLVPYNAKVRVNGIEKKERHAQFQIGYRGMIELMRRSGAVAQCETRAVFEGDEFDYSFGLTPTLVHRPLTEPDFGKLTHAYTIARFKDGTSQFDVMTRNEISMIAGRSKSRDAGGGLIGPWATDPIEMSKKCPVRRIAKLLPLSQELNYALMIDDERTVDVSAKVVIPPTFAPRNSARIIDTQSTSDEEAPPEGNESTGDGGDAPPEEQPPQRTPIDDFVARFEKAQTLDDLTKIAAQLKDDGISSAKEPRLLEAFKVAKARIAQKDVK